MNREIKFRTWDKENKEFSEWTNRDPCFDTATGKIFFWERTRKEDGSFSGDIILEDYNNRFILQQYTGLKDKDNREIYEGDIVKYKRGYSVTYEIPKGVFRSELVEQGEYVGEIIFIFPSFCWSYDHKKCDDIEPLRLARDRYEVIGNIFQNPELLN